MIFKIIDKISNNGSFFLGSKFYVLHWISMIYLPFFYLEKLCKKFKTSFQAFGAGSKIPDDAGSKGRVSYTPLLQNDDQGWILLSEFLKSREQQQPNNNGAGFIFSSEDDNDSGISNCSRRKSLM